MNTTYRDIATEKTQFSLDEIMLQAEKSLVVSGHTLDKFARDMRVKNALGTLFERGVHVTLVLLNPYCSYSQAHEHFHALESRGSAHEQILHTIRFLQGIFEDFNRPQEFEVYLTNYMPRFRTIIVDEQVCYVSLYMYGRDVGVTPEFKLTKQANLAWFEAVRDSFDQMVGSNDVILLIKGKRFNESWANTRIADILTRCLETSCCRGPNNSWNAAESVILGYQNNNPEMAYDMGICNRGYRPGTFTIDLISPAAQFLESPVTFNEWVDKVLEDEIELIQKLQPNLFQRHSQRSLCTQVKTALDLCRVGGTPLKQKIWYQEYSDIIRRLILTFLVHNPDFDLETYPNLTWGRRDFMLDILQWLEKYKRPSAKDWLHLSVAAGLLGVDEKPTHAATSRIKTVRAITLDRPDEDRGMAVQRVGSELWEAAKSSCRIDATNVFFDTLETSHGRFRLVSFLDDYLESIVMLKYYEELLRYFPRLEVDCIPRSIRCSNDATYDDIQGLLDHFPYLKTEKRFRVVENGPEIGGVNLLKLHPNIMRLIDEASALDVRGARNYEMMQGVNKETYYGFMVCREISESVTGLLAEDRPFVFIRQTPGECSFERFELRHERQEQGRMFAQVTVNDHKEKWAGGYGVSFLTWPDRRKTRYKVIREFYSAKAPDFHSKFGGLLEVEVKEFLNALSGRVLVIGCGSGKEVEYLSAKGCDVFGFDFSPDAIALAKQEFPHLKKRLFIEDLYNLDGIVSGEFDGIVANAVLVHLLDKDDMLLILKKIQARLKKNGLCFVRVIEKENMKEEFDKNLFGELRWFVYYTKDELKDLAEQAGFIVENMDRRPHAVHSHVHWVSALLRRPAEGAGGAEQYIEAQRGPGQAPGSVPSGPLWDLVKLREGLDQHFNDSELRTLCFDSGIDYDNLPGEDKAAKARELVAHCERRGRTAELVELCRRLRPKVQWTGQKP